MAKHAMEKKFRHSKNRVIQEFWIYLDPEKIQGDLGLAVEEAQKQFGLQPG